MPRTATDRRSRFVFGLWLVVAACHRTPPPAAVTPSAALSDLAAQHVIVLPTFRVRFASELHWETTVRPRDVQRSLDSAIAKELEARGLTTNWILPEALVQSYKRNPTYATDPYGLAEQPLIYPGLMGAGSRLPEPLASQLRTMIALHGDARFIVAPVDFWFDRLESGFAQPGLIVAVIDARGSDLRMTATFRGDTTRTVSPAVVTSMAVKFANLFMRQ